MSGMTSTGAALTTALRMVQSGRRAGGVVHVVVLTDGYSSDSVDAPAQALRQESQVRTYAVAVQSSGIYECVSLTRMCSHVYVSTDPT
jgi:uncharacterized protein with von Willebrand factor type A (vWA) domain